MVTNTTFLDLKHLDRTTETTAKLVGEWIDEINNVGFDNMQKIDEGVLRLHKDQETHNISLTSHENRFAAATTAINARLRYVGEWQSGLAVVANDVVLHRNSLFRARIASAGTSMPDANSQLARDRWERLTTYLPLDHDHEADNITRGIIAAARLPAIPTQAQAEAGTETVARLWSSQRVRQAINAVINLIVRQHTPLRNLAIGLEALFSNTLGENNTAIGIFALENNTGGDDNTAVGTRALELSRGTENTAIGSNALSNLVTGNNCTAIGYNSRTPAINTSNTVVLGDSRITHLRCQVQTITALSDPRTKEYHEPANIEKCFEAVKNLPVSRYKYKDFTGVHVDKNVLGFMADDMEKIFPKSVSTTDYYFPLYDETGDHIMEEVEVEREVEFVVIDGEELSLDDSDDIDKANNILAEIVQRVQHEQRAALQAALKQRVETIPEASGVETSGIEALEAEIPEIEMPYINSFPRIRKKIKRTEQRQKTHFLPNVKEITPTELVPALWGAVQFLSGKVEKLESRVAELEKNN